MLNTKRATLVQLAQYETRYTLVQLAQYKTRFTSLIMLPHCNMRFSELFWICFTNPLSPARAFFCIPPSSGLPAKKRKKKSNRS
jgi:hypothetical protein